MIGSHARQHPQIVRAVHAAGHLIGNHTTTHPWLTTCSPQHTREELTICTAILEAAIGAPIRYVRFPHGARLPHTIRIARELNLTPVQWNVMAHDWQPIGITGIMHHIDAGIARATRRHRGANICMHDGHQGGTTLYRPDTLAATTQLLNRFQQQGKRLVTVDAWA